MDYTVITFNTKGHDEFIDFIKAYAIICVLFGHIFLWLDKVAYDVWASMQVPLFILVQAFHGLKKGNAQINISMVVKRVILPFIIVQFVAFLTILFRGDNYDTIVINLLEGGGYGPGAYYPWIYVQVALLLPFMEMIFKKCNKWVSLIIIIAICEAMLFFCCKWICDIIE